MKCHTVIRMLSACQDGELDAALSREVEDHLRGCPSCLAQWGELQELVQRLRLSPAPRLDPFFPARVMAAVRPGPAKKLRLLPAAVYALVFVAIFAAGFLLQVSGGVQASAAPVPAATYSAVLLEPQDLGLLAVQDDTLKLFNGSDHGQK